MISMHYKFIVVNSDMETSIAATKESIVNSIFPVGLQIS